MPVLFLNAYNFVPLPKDPCVRESLEKGKLTGKIICTIIPKTDFFVPNTSNETCNTSGKHGDKVREFFSYKQLEDNYEMTNDNAPEHPVIPGSEIRGMVRSMYETMTNSCLSALDMPDILSSRSKDAKKPGLLYYNDGNWILIKAEKYYLDEKREFSGNDGLGKFGIDKTNKRYLSINGELLYPNDKLFFNYRIEPIIRNGQRIGKRNVVDNISADENCDQYSYPNEGYLFIGEDIKNKHYHYLFLDSEEEENINQDILSAAVKQYNENIRIYQKNSKQKGDKENAKKVHVGCEIPAKPADGSYFCVWYEIIGGRLYLSPSCLGRDTYYNKIQDFVHGHEPCSTDMLCDACRLFGSINDSRALGSRLRFADAVCTNKEPKYSDITTLKELSSPKLTCMEMYTKVKGNAEGSPCWTYDYYKNGRNKCLVSANELELNGRKFYYHHSDCNGSDYYKYNYIGRDSKGNRLRTVEETIEKNKDRLITIRALKGIAENSFTFDVYFEKITDEELEKLLLVLSLCGNENNHCYKIGMGKPIGLGSVKVKVENVYIRDFKNLKYNMEDKSKEFKKYFKENIDTSLVLFSEELKNLTDFEYALRLENENIIDGVHYPTTFNRNDEGFKWFVNNSRIGGNAGVEQKLQTTGCKAGVLKKNSAPQNNNHNNGRNNNHQNNRRR